MPFASTGPTTSVLEALATSVGFGLVFGGFVGGIVNFALTGSLGESEKWTLIGGYFGGLGALVLLAIDILLKSFV